MTNTKRNLLTSAISMLLCVAMLLGTTFAWFTDNATNTGNRIMAGNLDVKLLMWNGSDYEDISNGNGDIFAEADKALNSNETLWEPGKTQVVYLAIENAGSLDLKYKVDLKAYKDAANTINNIDMTPVMRYAITPDAKDGNGVTGWDANNAKSIKLGMNSDAQNVKLGKGDTHYFALSVHMLESATNEYQNASVLFDLIVNAAQVSSEEDSFSNEYDILAEYASLPVKVYDDVKVNASNEVETEVTLSGEGAKATIPEGAVVDSSVVDDGEAELVLNIDVTEIYDAVEEDLEENEAAAAVEITIEGLDDTNNVPVIIDVEGMFAKNLNGVKLYHNDELMTKKTSKAAVVNHNDYYYDSTTGDVRIATATFSTFTIVYDESEVELLFPEAVVEELSKGPYNATYSIGSEDAEELTFDKAYIFKTTETAEEGKASKYADWFADFVVTFNKDVKADTLGIAGYYEYWCSKKNNDNWLAFKAPDIKAGEPIRLLKSYDETLNIKYEELCELVKEFKCGAFDIDGQNKGTTITVELRLYETKGDFITGKSYETGNSYVVGSFKYTF